MLVAHQAAIPPGKRRYAALAIGPVTQALLPPLVVTLPAERSPAHAQEVTHARGS